MKSMTVNQIRVRLGKIVEKIFTDDFIEMYEMMAPQVSSVKDELLVDQLESTDAYTYVVADSLHNADILNNINKFLYPPVAYCFYVRYFGLSEELMKRNQEDVYLVPSDEKGLLIEMLITHWKHVFAGELDL